MAGFLRAGTRRRRQGHHAIENKSQFSVYEIMASRQLPVRRVSGQNFWRVAEFARIREPFVRPEFWRIRLHPSRQGLLARHCADAWLGLPSVAWALHFCNNQKSRWSRRPWGFEAFGLGIFRISCFGFRISKSNKPHLFAERKNVMAGTSEQRVREVILDSIADGVFTVDEDWNITSFNRAAERITGVPRTQAIGKKCFDVFQSNICQTNCALRDTIRTERQSVDRRINNLNSQGEEVPVSISTSVLRDEKGRAVGGVETFRDLSAIELLRKQVEDRYNFHDIITKSHPLLRILDILPDIAASDTTVLIEGPTGTGKELVAKAIHDLSRRAKQKYVAVNCGALPDTLLESELFGYKKGAFTDPKKDKPGRFALAKGGTLFPDAISCCGTPSPATSGTTPTRTAMLAASC